MDIDPIAQFFPNNPDISLYDVLSVSQTATASELKSAYRRLALLHHPDKHAASSPRAQKDASIRFQQVGFAYAVLEDEKRRKKYDETGSASEDAEWEGKDEEGWEMYFEQMFERVTRGKLDEMKKVYQGSKEELTDLRMAYIETSGSIDVILTHIPHSTYTDEPRFVDIINDFIVKGEIESLPAWTKGLKDKKGREARKKKGEKEAKEAESMAKELGVWDEFYGTGKEGKRRGKGEGRGKERKEEDEGDGEVALKALIQGRQKKLDGFLNNLAAKYGAAEEKPSRWEKRVASESQLETDEEFVRIQKKLKKGSTETSKKPSASASSSSKPNRGKKRAK